MLHTPLEMKTHYPAANSLNTYLVAREWSRSSSWSRCHKGSWPPECIGRWKNVTPCWKWDSQSAHSHRDRHAVSVCPFWFPVCALRNPGAATWHSVTGIPGCWSEDTCRRTVWRAQARRSQEPLKWHPGVNKYLRRFFAAVSTVCYGMTITVSVATMSITFATTGLQSRLLSSSCIGSGYLYFWFNRLSL